MTGGRIAELFDLSGRIALITGASSGIGRCLATALSFAGAAVVLVARRADKLEEAKAQIEAAGGKATAIPWDLSERDRLAALARAASVPFGAPAIVVNAAGFNLREHADSVSPEGWARTLALHLDAPFSCRKR